MKIELPRIALKIILSIYALLIYEVILAQAPAFEWAKKFGGQLGYLGKSIATDNLGNIFMVGTFEESIDFDPSEQEYILAPIGYRDAFILKINSNGDFIWVKQFGGDQIQENIYFTLDSDGNIYTSGQFYGIVDFDPGITVSNLLTLTSSSFISKLNNDGEYIWAKHINSLVMDNGIIMCNAIGVGNDGSLYTAGCFADSVDFNPDDNEYILTSSGSVDNYISKLDSNGNFVWAKKTGGLSDEEIHSIFIDNSYNVYTVGYFRDTADFDPSEAVYNLVSNGNTNGFISKLDVNGNFIWAKSVGNDQNFNSETFTSIAVDISGNVYSIGSFTGTVDLNPNEDTSQFTCVGSSDIFILKLNSTGEFTWAKQFGGLFYDYCNSITLNSGNLYFTGSFNDTLDMDPSNNIYNLISQGDNSMFTGKIDIDGNFIWAIQSEGSAGSCEGNQVKIDNYGNIFTSGSFNDTVDFDHSNEIFNLVSNEYSSLFIQKLSQDQINGISEKEKNEKINLFPNPSKGIFNFNSNTNSEITITNILGENIMTKKLDMDNNIIDISNQSDGLYFARFIEGGVQKFVKLIKQN
jgi:Secretion system C-terminal sorting domain/Beta-propeller repeat